MPYIPHTPESLLPRSDSKNPSTTCKGITSGGRPCRRSLANSPRASPPGLIAIISEDDSEAAGYFCWQHKDQAEKVVIGVKNTLRRGDGTGTGDVYQQRTSIDTLVDRIGILDIGTATKVHKANAKEKTTRRGGRGGQKTPGLLSIFCCIEYDSNDDEPKLQPPRPRNGEYQPKRQRSFEGNPTAPLPGRPPLRSQPDTGEKGKVGSVQRPAPTPISTNVPRPTMLEDRRRAQIDKTPIVRTAMSQKPANQLYRPSLPRDVSTQTAYLLSLIPKHLSPQTTSLLLAELAKPISGNDDEGYIYIFWLTDSDITAAPSPKAVSALLSPPSASYNRKHGRPNEILEAASVNNEKKSNILLKIGRASNVHRRLNEWTRQCGYNLSLIRYYPHVPAPSLASSPSASPSASPLPASTTPRKVPNAHRVERLIHIELADQRVKQGLCGKCGKDHREWFAVDASREGLRAVDEVVRRWVGWGETR
ncbi:hypothetical protein FGG08_001442 [Glutinoglossum americanum]|uniref:Bacteriophage T5 Orf172 DNA-binding domain-containing protein n=1 Tax=Glutinoglossum americanum TaxID=1670608 RepID=A0A9P8IDI6_9PEZI|nr:hypothetical protein FGG08_001442 [Glutinoglossum americanum]